MASPFSLEEKQVLLEAQNLDIRKNKIAEILKTYTHDIYENNTHSIINNSNLYLHFFCHVIYGIFFPIYFKEFKKLNYLIYFHC